MQFVRLIPLTAAAFLLLTASAHAGAWRVVTFPRTVQAADRAIVAQAGGATAHAAGARRYLVFTDRAGARRLARRAAVRRVRAGEKIAPEIRHGLATVVRARGGRRVVEIVRLDAALTPPALARRADVLHVGSVPTHMHPEDEGTSQVQAGNHDDEGAPRPGYEQWLEGVGLQGRGVRIAIVDTGMDETHPDLADRFVGRIDYEFPAPVPTPLDVDEMGHGTHVAGIVAGNPDQEGQYAFQDLSGLYLGLGVAPSAELFSMNGIALTAPELVPFIPTLTRDAVRSGSIAWNASWHTGEGKGSGYIETVREIDSLARDADRETPGNQPLTMVFSAGNEGSDEQTITVPKEAKNIITVGASKGQRAGDTEQMASFSSRGPAADGRILPNVVAPGEAISSARSKPAGGLCFQPVTDGPSPIHSLCSGTSMAAPHVAGAVALVADWWRRFNGGANPSTAMTKALLINSAYDMGDRDVPNSDEGWGRVHLANLFGTAPADRVLIDQSDLMTDPGAIRSWSVTPVDPAKPMRATLVWTDAPGAAAADDEAKKRPALVNDLDLVVRTLDGSAYAGNAFADGRSVPGGAADRLNNIENVWLDQAGAAPHEISIVAHALPGDGLPGSGDTTDQDYALVVTNARPTPPMPQAAAPAAAPAPRLEIRTRRAKLRRRVKVSLRTSEPLKGLRATLHRRGKRIATARLKSLRRNGRITFKLPRRTRAAAYVLSVKGRTADGRAVGAKRILKLTR